MRQQVQRLHGLKRTLAGFAVRGSSAFTARAGTSIGDQGEHSNMMPHYGPMDCFLISRASLLLLSNGLQEEEEEKEEEV